MKKKLILLLALMISMSFAACTKTDDKDKTEDTKVEVKNNTPAEVDFTEDDKKFVFDVVKELEKKDIAAARAVMSDAFNDVLDDTTLNELFTVLGDVGEIKEITSISKSMISDEKYGKMISYNTMFKGELSDLDSVIVVSEETGKLYSYNFNLVQDIEANKAKYPKHVEEAERIINLLEENKVDEVKALFKIKAEIKEEELKDFVDTVGSTLKDIGKHTSLTIVHFLDRTPTEESKSYGIDGNYVDLIYIALYPDNKTIQYSFVFDQDAKVFGMNFKPITPTRKMNNGVNTTDETNDSEEKTE